MPEGTGAISVAVGVRTVVGTSLIYQVGLLVVKGREAAEAVLETAVNVVVTTGDALTTTADAAGRAGAGLFRLFSELLFAGVVVLEGATAVAITTLEATRRWASIVVAVAVL